MFVDVGVVPLHPWRRITVPSFLLADDTLSCLLSLQRLRVALANIIRLAEISSVWLGGTNQAYIKKRNVIELAAVSRE